MILKEIQSILATNGFGEFTLLLLVAAVSLGITIFTFIIGLQTKRGSYFRQAKTSSGLLLLALLAMPSILAYRGLIEPSSNIYPLVALLTETIVVWLVIYPFTRLSWPNIPYKQIWLGAGLLQLVIIVFCFIESNSYMAALGSDRTVFQLQPFYYASTIALGVLLASFWVMWIIAFTKAPNNEKKSMVLDILALSVLSLGYLFGLSIHQYGATQLDTLWQGLSVNALVLTSHLILNGISIAQENKRIETLYFEDRKKLEFAAYHDELTGLHNRVSFFEDLGEIVETGRKSFNEEFHGAALLYLDLDHFKDVNDTLGNTFGNGLLKEAARRLKKCLSEDGSVYRIGGDEFSIIIQGKVNEVDIALLCERVTESFNQPFDIDGHLTYMTTSIGVSVFPRDGSNVEDLSMRADQALIEAKVDRNTYRLFTHKMHERVASKLQFITLLRRALERNELSLWYQPQIANEKVIGAEALVRWHSAEMGIISPAEFIPIAEETGIIVSIGQWIIQEAARELARWHRVGLKIPMSINLSPRQLKDAKFQRIVSDAIRQNNLDPSYLHFEITENSLVGNSDRVLQKLRAMTEMGVKFSIDDFGTGYSSLSYLKNLPVATVKIDRSFVTELPFNHQDAALVQAIISMAKGLGMEVIAEGVDSIEQLEFLHQRKCSVIQGYYYSKPLPSADFLNYVQTLIA